jgi:hypothetical protein
MRGKRIGMGVAAVFAWVVLAQAMPFAMFPKAGQLVSQDGRFVVRNSDRGAPASEYLGTFHSLILEDTASGRTRKLCDYVGMAALAWTKNDSLVMTEYVSKHTSRVWIFRADDSRDAVLIDQALLTRILPVELRPQVRENDHVFVEASQIEGETLTVGVWGYGKHDANGFRWRCQYGLGDGAIACADSGAGKQ